MLENLDFELKKKHFLTARFPRILIVWHFFVNVRFIKLESWNLAQGYSLLIYFAYQISAHQLKSFEIPIQFDFFQILRIFEPKVLRQECQAFRFGNINIFTREWTAYDLPFFSYWGCRNPDTILRERWVKYFSDGENKINILNTFQKIYELLVYFYKIKVMFKKHKTIWKQYL